MTVRAADNVEVWQRRIQKLRGVHLNLSLSLNNSNNSPTISYVSACYHFKSIHVGFSSQGQII
jgi:hypothetical protein